jgi:type I restriction enzyme R subunit
MSYRRPEAATLAERLLVGGAGSEFLEQSVRKYQNRAIETAQVIEELIQLAKDMCAAGARGEQPYVRMADLPYPC